MRAVIIRHGKVNFHWKKWSTSKQFDQDCIAYDEAPIISLSSDGSWIGYQEIYISSLRRSQETASQLFGERNFIATKLIDEVPLCAGITSNQKLPLLFWNVLGRLQWFFNVPSQREGRRETIDRAERFAEMVQKRETDCIIVTHGFFMHTLLKQMKKKAFQISHTRFRYANGDCVIAKR